MVTKGVRITGGVRRFAKDGCERSKAESRLPKIISAPPPPKTRLLTGQGHSSEEQKWNRDCQLDRVTSSAEAALAALHVMTAPRMPKAVYIDDVMERAASLLKQQLNNTVYPEYDPVYRNPSTSGKKKGSKGKVLRAAAVVGWLVGWLVQKFSEVRWSRLVDCKVEFDSLLR